MADLDSEVCSKAFRARNGEFAWRREHVELALDAIQKSHLAILGWEVWLVIGDQWTGLIPSIRQEPDGVWSFDTSPRRSGEDWLAYCTRTVEETRNQIKSQPVEAESSPRVRDRLRFNFTYVDVSDR
ncbi:MAG: hypothetical protein SFZ23_04040 [Planctomycetota bacterium]|nr:hypothetical protein [Planctomycetota bacterium]